MGVSANLLVNQRNGVAEIKKLLKDGFGFKIIETDLKDDHAFLTVEHRNQTSRLYIAKTQSYGGLDATVISSGSRPENIELFKQIAKVLGGMIQESEYDSNWYDIHEPHSGNARFVLEHTILTQAIGQNNTQVKAFTDSIAKAIGYK